MLLGSGMQDIFVCGIRNTENFVCGIRNTRNFCLWDPEYGKFLFVGSHAAQAHYVWVRASEVIWSEYTRIISALSDAK